MRRTRRDRPRQCRRGATLIELLVVVGVIGLLAAIAIPAVSAIREAARRTQCANNLKQLAAALQQHHAARGTFPAALPTNLETGLIRSRHFSPFVFLLPHLGQDQVYDRLNLVHDTASWDNPAADTRIAVFLCPADGRVVESGGNGNYRVNLGPELGWLFERKGAFEIFRPLSMADFTDGTSHTVALSERLLGDDDEQRFSRTRDYWFTSLDLVTPGTPTAAELEPVCQGLSADNPPHWSASGRQWFFAGFGDTWYNHAATPNTPMADCTYHPGGQRNYLTGGFFTARSRHGGGVQAATADGAVRFVADAIDRVLWQAVATPAGGEAGHEP